VPEYQSDDETTPETRDDGVGSATRGADHGVATGLVVLWSVDEPDRLGSWLPGPRGDGDPRLLGRGPARADDEYPRLSSFSQRPEQNELLPPLRGEALSRSQLLVRRVAPGLLDITNLGRRKLTVNGALATQCEVREGDVLEIGSRFVLLCSTRPSRLPGSFASTEHPLGEVDEHGLVGESPVAWRLRGDVAFAARRTGHVLILGPTGVGKELVATAIHAIAARSGAFISRNAATLPESLVDAELFGNPKGYPNPGVPEREGLIGAAHQGSLFLDEFADLPSGAQAHLLRVLDSGEYQRLGESRQRRSDFRLIAATNRAETALREDLLARFDFRLRLPDLAARREDIPLILRHLFTTITREEPELRERYGLPNGLPRVGPSFIRRLVQHSYPGNVRELRQLLWRSLAESSSDALEWPERASSTDADEDADPTGVEVQRALDANNGSLEKTWKTLGLANRYVLRRLVVKHGLSVTRRGS
jgi:two-component system nitrogen regulation response regulator GlnG/two-component system response regulator HydG